MAEEIKNKQVENEDNDDNDDNENKEIDEIVSEIAEKVDGFFYNKEPEK